MRKRPSTCTLALCLAAFAAIPARADTPKPSNPPAPKQASATTVAPRAAGPADPLLALVGGAQWGWSRQRVYEHLRARMEAAYQKKLSETLAARPSALDIDAMKREMADRLQAIRASYIAFDGKPSGYDSGQLAGQFTQNNDESMLRDRRARYDDYYFFIQGRLWKVYRAFRVAAFPGVTFDAFVSGLTRRFGEPVAREEHKDQDGAAEAVVRWRNATTEMRANDESATYGAFALVFVDRATEAKLPALRKHAPAPKTNPARDVVDVVAPRDAAPPRDPNADVVDRLTKPRAAPPAKPRAAPPAKRP